MTMQITNTILMIRPVSFRMNEQTAVNNYFMEDIDIKNNTINEKAQEEFDGFVSVLKENGVNVIVIDDTKEPDTRDHGGDARFSGRQGRPHRRRTLLERLFAAGYVSVVVASQEHDPCPHRYPDRDRNDQYQRPR